jgi:uncharacterized protein (TIGR02217 family)
MPITIYNDVILPETVQDGHLRGKNQRMNQRVANQAGYMTVNAVWVESLRRFEVGVVPMALDVWKTIEGLYEVTCGGVYGFLMSDPKDHTVDAGEGLLRPYSGALGYIGTIGEGYGTPTYRLIKRYSVAGSTRTRDRRIVRPNLAAVTRGGAAVTAGASAGNIAIDSDTGLITFVPDTTQLVNSITTGASTVVNFANGLGIVAALGVGDRVYLAGITGSAAAALNGKSHAITAKGATSLTVSTNTSGLSGAAGTAYKYPQESEALVWTGTFYVPVHFESDDIDWEILASGSAGERVVAGPQVVLVEIREP